MPSLQLQEQQKTRTMAEAAPAAEEKAADQMSVDAKEPAAEGSGVRFEIRKWNAVCM